MSDIFTLVLCYVGCPVAAFFYAKYMKRKLTDDPNNKLKLFLAILGTCFFCSFVPMGILGAIFGFPAYFVASLMITEVFG